MRYEEPRAPGKPNRLEATRGLGLVLLMILLGIFFLQGKKQPGPSPLNVDNAIAEFCRTDPGKVTEVIDSWTRLGVLKSYSRERMDVDDKPWEYIPYNAKVSIAVAGYCRAIQGTGSDAATVLIRGYRSGNTLASITDGNFFH